MELRRTPTVRIFMKFDIPIHFRKSVEIFFLLVSVGPQAAKKSRFIFSIQMCTIVFMTTCYPPLSRITSIHFTTSNPIFWSTLILSSQLQLCLPSCLFPYDFPTKTHCAFPFHPAHPTFPAHPIIRDVFIRTTG